MKKLITKSILALVAVGALCAGTKKGSAQQPTSLQGIWNSQVTLTDCNGNTLAAFRAMEMFIVDGSLISVDNSPPTAHGTGFGRWRHLSGQNYGSPFQFYNFDSDGNFSGLQKIHRKIVLAANGNSYTSTVTFETLDPDGNVVFSGCGTETATRLQPFSQSFD